MGSKARSEPISEKFDQDNVRRLRIVVLGTVQGVGFRPFIYGAARRLSLTGFVRNEVGRVLIEAQGLPHALDRLVTEIRTEHPPLAKVEQVFSEFVDSKPTDQFQIEPSRSSPTSFIQIPADVGSCTDCLKEICDPSSRRYSYAFTNCTNCGPRSTIIQDSPYDRERTTMATFPMCLDCRSEYEDPSSRWFHAQPIACPNCGPALRLLGRDGRELREGKPISVAASLLKSGGIVAIKGLGGYHLACNALDETAVRELRARKNRAEKPFAVMVGNLADLQSLCFLTDEERGTLGSPERPIVLLRQRPKSLIAPSVAPRNPFLGVMLPSTPLHYLLLQALDGLPLVMTSGNQSDEPIAYDDADAFSRLGKIADGFLTHDRDIHFRSDDSVIRLTEGRPTPIRRSRGYSPHGIRLPAEAPIPLLAFGGHLKNTFALGLGHTAIISHHIGDLGEYLACEGLRAGVEHYKKLFNVSPKVLIHDLHPDYASTRYALEQGKAHGIQTIAVQHHHAHMASCMAENGITERVIGVTFDGTGLGTDGAIWGGEFLAGDYSGFERMAHFRYVPIAGGDQAIREPWRMALAHLIDSGADCALLEARISQSKLRTIRQMIERKFNSPPTSSVGRLFDAVASIAGVRDFVSFEAQAAMELEYLSMQAPSGGAYSIDFDEASGEVDTRPMIREIVRDLRSGETRELIARKFHTTLIEVIARVCVSIRQRTSLAKVVLSGGVFMNAILLAESVERLEAEGFEVFFHRQVPPNDGGLSLGQLAIAAAVLKQRGAEQCV